MPQFRLPDLRLQFARRYPKAVDLRVIATQLGIPPDLKYLRDGLRLSRGCVAAYPDELAGCLRAIPGARLDVDDLIPAIDALVDWIDHQDWAADDERLWLMERQSETDPHPLAGYCLGVLHHWSNLFYTLEPSAGVSLPKRSGTQRYEELMQEFSAYVIAAQSTIDPADYDLYCQTWCVADKQPDAPPYEERRLASRVASASRAMRRITLVEYRKLFDALVDLQHDRPFHARVFDALLDDWGPAEAGILEAIARLLEDIKPGWMRPGNDGVDRTTGARISAKGTVRPRYRDGYVRVADSDVIVQVVVTEDGLAYEALRPAPQTAEGRAKTLATQALEDDENEGESSEPVLDRAERKRLRDEQNRKYLAEALARADGEEWMPVDDRAGGDVIEAALIEEDGDSAPESASKAAGSSSRWAAQHLRRSHFAHALWRDRLRLDEVRRLLGAMLEESPKSVGGPALICLHAALATGRPLKAATKLVITTDTAQTEPEADELTYRLDLKRWILPVPPPAWGDQARMPTERPTWTRLYLSDWTGFHQLLAHFGFDRVGRPVKRLSEIRERELHQWIELTLPDAPPSMSACKQFLFYRLLAVNRGDLGVARLITGQSHSHADSVGHYAHYDAPVLWRAYRSAWRDDSSPVSSVRSGNSVEADPERQNGYGARRVPRLDDVKRLIAFLQQRLRATGGAERHNLYTAYTLCGLVLGLGMRPVREPHLLDFAERALSSMLTTYLDKAKTDYHRRVNALPVSLGRHLERYAHYLRTLDRFDGADGSSANPRFRFWDPASGEWSPFLPSQFEALAKPTFDLELYALRRFARTQLLSDPVVEAEDVDAFMGHWFDRVSPHDPLSTYPMRRLQSLADGPVQKMLNEVGFKALWMPA